MTQRIVWEGQFGAVPQAYAGQLQDTLKDFLQKGNLLYPNVTAIGYELLIVNLRCASWCCRPRYTATSPTSSSAAATIIAIRSCGVVWLYGCCGTAMAATRCRWASLRPSASGQPLQNTTLLARCRRCLRRRTKCFAMRATTQKTGSATSCVANAKKLGDLKNKRLCGACSATATEDGGPD